MSNRTPAWIKCSPATAALIAVRELAWICGGTFLVVLVRNRQSLQSLNSTRGQVVCGFTVAFMFVSVFIARLLGASSEWRSEDHGGLTGRIPLTSVVAWIAMLIGAVTAFMVCEAINI